MIDNEFTKKILAWLEGEHKTGDEIRKGAMLLLQINKNRALFQTIIRRPQRYAGKLEYELNKHVKYRLDGLTHSEMKKMVADVLPKVEDVLENDAPEGVDDNSDTDGNEQPTGEGRQPVDITVHPSGDAKPRHGKRADHDELPDDIKALWDNNAERWKKMKEAFATCKTLESDCDRYEYVKVLKEAYEAYKRDMARYDSYDPAAAAMTAKDISNARSYISKYRKALEDAIAAGDTEKSQDLAQKIQQRVDTLTKANAELSDDLRQWLTDHEFTL